MLILGMPLSASKRAKKARQKQHLTRSMQDMGLGSASAILSSAAAEQHAKQLPAGMAPGKNEAELCTGGDLPEDMAGSVNHEAKVPQVVTFPERYTSHLYCGTCTQGPHRQPSSQCIPQATPGKVPELQGQRHDLIPI